MNNPNSSWQPLTSVAFENERELQTLVETGSAELIPADPSTDDSFIVYAREVPTASGPIDLVGIGSSGSITIMECKLAQNHDIKRKVVGQVLDYAASLWETDVASLVANFSAKTGVDLFEALRGRYGSDAEAFDEELCRTEIARRLRDGDFRLLIAVDQVDPELWRIIQYVNSRGAPGHGLRLVALAFQRFEQGSTQVLVPEAYGDELAPPQQSRELTATQHLHLAYWTEFRTYLGDHGSGIEMPSPKPTSIAVSRTDLGGLAFHFWNRMNDGWSGVSAHPMTEATRTRLTLLAQDRERAADRLGAIGNVHWDLPPKKQVSVWIDWQGTPTDRATWPDLMERMAKALEALNALFREA